MSIRRTGLVVSAILLASCSEDPEPDVVRDELLDPKNCEECHPVQYRQWLGSMHAYAGEDPVFRAMNARGQRETDGALGDFCIRCHAPVAVELGLTDDGLNLDEVPKHLQGIGCYWCHSTIDVTDSHNNGLVSSMSNTLLGPYSDPVDNGGFHSAAYGEHQDGATLASSDACGSCHDIVLQNGVHLERTYAEYLASFYGLPLPENPSVPMFGITCANCHMPSETGPIADFPGVEVRKLHDHRLAAVDVALTDFPDAELGPQLRAEQLEQIAENREIALCAGVCVNPNDADGQDVEVWLHNEGMGHGWPSGALQDRRAWVQVQAFVGDDVVFESGNIADDQPVEELDDPMLWQFRDWIYGADGEEVHMFWEVEDLDTNVLEAPAELGAAFDRSTWLSRTYSVDSPMVDRIEVVVKIRPMSLTVLEDLVESGDLDPAIVDAMPTFEVTSTQVEWTVDEAELSMAHGPCTYTSLACFSPILEE